MAKITAAEVNKLRKMTGAGMMDCKKALVETDGDFEKAMDYLRKKGQKIAAKRADKDAGEGLVIAKANANANFAAVIMVNCETDFVSKGDDFSTLANSIADKAIEAAPKTLEELKGLDLNGRTVEENVSDLMGKVGEKMEVSAYEFIEAPVVAAYNHLGNRLATVLGINKEVEEGTQIAKELAMQVAAMSPVAVDKDDVEKSVIDKELEIGMDQARQEGKPEAMLEKIAMGKVNKFLKENTLLNQDFVRENKKPVRTYLQEKDKDLTVTGFKRVALSN